MSAFNLTTFLFEKNLEDHPEKVALVFLDESGILQQFTYRQLYREIEGTASLLSSLTSSGDRILLRLRSEPRMAISFFAAILVGRIPVPVSPLLTSEETDFLVQDSGSVCMLYDSSLPAPVASGIMTVRINDLDSHDTGETRLHRTQYDDPAYLIYTSGTTGYPRGVLHAQRSVLGRLPMRADWTGLEPEDRLLHAGEMNWSYTLGVGLMDVFNAGATALLFGGNRRDPSIWPRLILNHRITIFAAVPGLFRRILKYGNVSHWEHFRHGLTAGDALPPGLLEEWQKKTGTPLLEALGMTEISTYISTGPSMKIQPGSPGRPQTGRRVALLDPATGIPFYDYPSGASGTGLLAIHRSDPGLMLQYWNGPKPPPLNRIDPPFYGEWFSGGDLARFDEQGFMIFEGRSNDLMNSGGYRVSPLEIERVLHQHPSVLDAAVLELSVSEGLSIITAWIVKGNDDVDEAAFIEHCHNHLASYKCPKQIVFSESLPRTASGKLLRKALALPDH